MESEINKLKIKRRTLKAQLTRFSNHIESLDFDKLTDVIVLDLKNRLANFTPSLNNFNEVQLGIEIIDPEGVEEESISFEKNYYALLSRVQGVISKYEDHKINVISTSVNPKQTTSNIKLPVIKLPVFNGEYDQWIEFRDAFKAMVHNNPAIGKSEKFYYLRSSLSEEASHAIQNIEVSDSNYEMVWELLMKRYENKQLIVFTHVKNIFELEYIHKESYVELRRLSDNITKHIRALSSLGLPTENWDILMIHIITMKLDPVTRRNWEEYEIEGELPKLEEMITFLKNRCELLEKLQFNKKELMKSNGNFSNQKNKQKVQVNLSKQENGLKCFFCKGAHAIYNCESFLKLPIEMRIQEAKNRHLCLNCLRPGHSNQFCRLNGCKKCNRKHNSLVHLERSSEKIRTEVEESPSHNEVYSSTTQVTTCNLNLSAQQAILSTAIVLVKDNHDNFHEARVFLDCGSQSNFITMNLCTKLGLPKKKVEFSVEGVGQSLTSIDHSTTVSLRAKFGNFVGDVSCLIIPKITGPIPSESFEGSQLSIPNNIRLADPNFHCKGEIDILIGARHFWNLLCVGQIELGRNLPLLQKTQLGWVVAGGSIPNAKYNYSYCTVSKNMTPKTNSDIDTQLTKFWHIEEYSTNKSKLSKDERFCEDHFMNTHTKNVEGRFIVSMPLRETDTISVNMLGNSKNIALKRFYAIEKKLNRDPILKSQYVKFMDDYENLGYMHEIPENSSDLFSHTDEICYYLPHHAVIKEASLTTKLRVVFDASMKTDSGLSLNDVQYVGPTVQDDLISIILRFRKYRFVISGDISKMYLQILITESQWPLQKIWWRKEPFERLRCFELNTVTFGTASAPYLATRCLRQLANENESSLPVISRVIREDFYMDDLLTGADCIDDLLEIQAGVHSILYGAGFELRKYRTNNLAVQNAIKVHSEIECSILDLGDSHNKTLGLMWNSELDYIQYSIKVTMGPVTKRTILSTIAKIYDPLGLLGPVIVIAKMIMQQLWQSKLSWDEGIPQNIQTRWIKFRDNLYILNEINIPRWVLSSYCKRIELHAFSDASESAYGVCVYIRCEEKDGSYKSSLLCAKSRVAPIKKVSLPRLELCGAYELAHLVTKIRSAVQIKFNAYYYWTDSTIALCWIKSDSSRWKTFVANRTSEIQSLTNEVDWHHVNSAENPADLLSRGIDADQIKSSELWWKGPPWLEKNESSWNHIDAENVSDIPEQRIVVAVAEVVNKTSIEFFSNLFSRFSKYMKLQRVVAYLLRYYSNLRCPALQDRQLGVLTASECRKALYLIVSVTQQEVFPQEYVTLKNNRFLDKSSKLLCLNPFMDAENKVIRVGGRISNANYRFDKIHPMILPAKHVITRLIFEREHERLLHCGPQQLLYSIRQQFWPLCGRNTSRLVVRKCIKCFKSNPEASQYIMGNLPSARLSQCFPFHKTGVDYAGPILIKDRRTRGAKLIKSYICLFICFSTKAMHLEVVTDLTTDAFLACLKRFVARRGKPEVIYSDNGSNFVGADAKLKEFSKFIKDNAQTIINNASNESISWKFIPAKSPNFGGLWEAGVKSVKRHITRVIGNAHLTYEEFTTVIIQIESVLNSRPLNPLSSDPTDFNPLTPSHFLIGRAMTAIPEPSVLHIQENRLNKYQRQLQILQHFWRRWHKEYISELQVRSKWKSSFNTSLETGNLVIIKEDNQPPLKWTLGRITELHRGKDDVVRVVSVQIGNHIFKRPVTKICVLPINDIDNSVRKID